MWPRRLRPVVAVLSYFLSSILRVDLRIRGKDHYKAFTKDASRLITDYCRNDMHSKGKIANIIRSGT